MDSPKYCSFEPQTQALVLEIGPGDGAFLLHCAQNNPTSLFVGIEIKKSRFLKIAKKIENQPPPNFAMILADARHCLPKIFADASLSEIYILFPDPWPKRRHHKHRLLQPHFTELLHRLLKPSGKVWVATDHPNYAKQVSEVFSNEQWQFQESQSLYPTYFEKKWKAMGLSIHYFSWIRR